MMSILIWMCLCKQTQDDNGVADGDVELTLGWCSLVILMNDVGGDAVMTIALFILPVLDMIRMFGDLQRALAR